MTNVADGYDGFDAAAAEQLRQDQCLMADALRLGGTSTVPLAQNALNQTADQLHTAANREYWNDTPLSTAFQQDRDTIDAASDVLPTRLAAWQTPLKGLSFPANFATDAEFYWPPGVPATTDNFFDQVGYGKWLGAQWWKTEGDLYKDPTAPADDATVQAVKALGTPLYGTVDPSLPTPQWQQAYAEHQAFEQLVSDYNGTGADDARMFLSSGGFPRTAAEPGSLEFRIAVEDLKSRFAACAWRNPIDPNKVLGQEVATASAEWQQELAAQATQRNQILDANTSATKALTTTAQALGEMLGQSWIADHLARWQDYWSAGGAGWIGDSPMAIHVHGSSDKCLEVGGNSTANAAIVQIYTCNGNANQQWRISGDTLVNVNSGKCLVPKASASADGTAMVQGACDVSSTSANRWKYNPHATTPLTNLANGKCLNLPSYTNSQDATLATCSGSAFQKLDLVPVGHNGTDDLDYPTSAQFLQATKGIAAAQSAAQTQLTLIQKQAQTATSAVTSTDTSLNAAYAIADQAGAPRGRGLLVGLQKAQVTKASSAAINAMQAAAQTALSATKASAADSATIAARAVTQGAASTAAFRNAAAEAAKEQAKAAADAAAVQAGNAKAARDTAKAKLAVAVQAETDAKAAAATAHARRLDAEAEEATAEAEKETAAQKQAEAAEHKTKAQGYASQAEDAKDKAEAADATATAKRQAAETASDNAKDLRDKAWDAKQKADAARAKSYAKETFAEAHESDDQAQSSRQAADAADAAADDAESAADSARSEADAATQAAADADAAATRAEAAAKRAHADADAAQSAKEDADAAVATATSAAADAIAASRTAATAASAAVKLADEAEGHAADAKAQADAANTAAQTAIAGANVATGHAYAASQAAVDAGNAARQVAAPANDAVQLGAPYVTTDSAAGLAVLTGQSSRTIAEQQQAVAEAHAQNAQEAAAQATSTANAATGDAKAAYTLAAEAAGYAADARASAKQALDYSAEAAGYASQAAQSLARTIAYDKQATDDAKAADDAAGRADGYAAQARDSADAAALDAQAARDAASQAEQAAEDARAAAKDADAQATAAEEAAKDAQKYAESAQQAATEAANAQANQQVGAGAGTGIGGTFYVVDKDTINVTDVKQDKPCEIPPGFGTSCTVTFTYTFDVSVDFYLCVNPDVPATAAGCPDEDTLFLKTERLKGLTKDDTKTFTQLDILKGLLNTYQTIGKEILVQDFVDCWHGSAGGCAWAASNFIPGKTLEKIAEGFRALDAAMQAGTGIRDAFDALKVIDGLDPSTLKHIEDAVDELEDVISVCTKDSFPASTGVVLADGSVKSIRAVRSGDLLRTTDPVTGRTVTEPVISTHRHDTSALTDVTVGGALVTSTTGHRFYVEGRGWTAVSDLRVGDLLRASDGSLSPVTALREHGVLAPRDVYDLTVQGTHTFYVRADGSRSRDVLVHNCTDIIGDEGLGGAHTLRDHVEKSDQQMLDKANAETKGVATRWTDEATAAEAVNKAVTAWTEKNAVQLQNWVTRQAQRMGKKQLLEPKSFTWDVRDMGPSLGKVWVRGGSLAGEAAGTKVVVTLKYVGKVQGHSEKWVVYTAYPEG
ncbi:RNase A-like domain-containing protein [Streptomyces sp. NPDC086777]|uniref:RICIN domain-containing protein n=1 Tax=Streptomyces sp. NPDC086777 TaxID=3154866 RepID=UPI00344CF367